MVGRKRNFDLGRKTASPQRGRSLKAPQKLNVEASPAPYGVLKIAPTESLLTTVNVQTGLNTIGVVLVMIGVATQFEDQPPNDDPVAGVAVSVTV
jgi:hypothetical protein